MSTKEKSIGGVVPVQVTQVAARPRLQETPGRLLRALGGSVKTDGKDGEKRCVRTRAGRNRKGQEAKECRKTGESGELGDKWRRQYKSETLAKGTRRTRRREQRYSSIARAALRGFPFWDVEDEAWKAARGGNQAGADSEEEEEEEEMVENVRAQIESSSMQPAYTCVMASIPVRCSSSTADCLPQV
ncbi:hypothetical protein RUM44_005001 [Polyplax serrata]|uniref:Uncharacterized protein n=1 Tax=Polyplax serrata TaxID=468196 RepID=A0ABR1AWQ3_POLSC